MSETFSDLLNNFFKYVSENVFESRIAGLQKYADLNDHDKDW